MMNELNYSNYLMDGNSSSVACDGTTCIYNVESNYSMADDANEELENFQLQSRFWVQRVLVPIIMTIGVVGNTVTIVIMTQRRMRSSTNCYLAALAILDMSYLIFSFLLSFQHYPHIHDVRYHFYWNVWPYMLTLADASSNSSVWLTVTFTVERYVAVCHPMKGKVLCTESRAKKMILIVFLVCFLITLPTAFEWKIVEVTNAVTNTTQIWADYSELGHNRLYVSVYYWMVSVTFIMVPFVLLAVFNAFLIKSVHSSKTQRKTMTRRRETGDQAKQESKITIMLIAVVILFFLCQLPTAVILLYRSFQHVEDGGREDLLLRGLGNIFNFLVAVNAAGNFVLYCLLSLKYRRTFVQIFCSCGRSTAANQTTFYSTVGNDSPAVTRKYCSKPPVVKTNSVTGNVRQIPYGSPVKEPDFPKTALVYSNSLKMGQYATVEESNHRRLLRGFRCPWKRQKIVSGANPEVGANQMNLLRSNNTNDRKSVKHFRNDTYDNTHM